MGTSPANACISLSLSLSLSPSSRGGPHHVELSLFWHVIRRASAGISRECGNAGPFLLSLSLSLLLMSSFLREVCVRVRGYTTAGLRWLW